MLIHSPLFPQKREHLRTYPLWTVQCGIVRQGGSPDKSLRTDRHFLWCIAFPANKITLWVPAAQDVTSRKRLGYWKQNVVLTAVCERYKIQNHLSKRGTRDVHTKSRTGSLTEHVYFVSAGTTEKEQCQCQIPTWLRCIKLWLRKTLKKFFVYKWEQTNTPAVKGWHADPSHACPAGHW